MFGRNLAEDIYNRADKIEKERKNMTEDKDEIDWGSDDETAEMAKARNDLIKEKLQLEKSISMKGSSLSVNKFGSNLRLVDNKGSN